MFVRIPRRVISRLTPLLLLSMAGAASYAAQRPSDSAMQVKVSSARVSSNKIHIFAFTGAANPAATVARLPSVVDGVSWDFAWSGIEPSPGVYNWKPIDDALAASSAAGKLAIVRINAGHDSPAWVQPQISMTVSIPSKMTIKMPPPFNPSFIADWTQFIAAYGARYNGDPRIWLVEMAGGGWQGEMTLPQWQGWWTNGLTNANMINAWDTFIGAYRRAFPSTPSALGIDEPLTHVNPHSLILSSVLQRASTFYPSVYIQQNGLNPVAGIYYNDIVSASASTTVGWQMNGSNHTLPYLHSSFTNAINSHASYVEVYLVDCVNSAALPELQYLAAG